MLDEIFSLLDDAGINDPGLINLRQYLHLKQIGEHSDLIVDLTRGSEIRPGIDINPGDDELSLFSGTLYPYQHDGWQWLSYVCKQQVGGILADEMGLGKTVQIIAVLASPDRERVSPSVIIAPGSLLENWKREIVRFAPEIRVLVHHGPIRTGLPKTLLEFDVIVTSYDTAVRDGALFGMIEWRLVILDEAQAIKNPDTRRAQSIKKLTREAGIAVTGTPVENRLRDLWSIMDFVLPGYLGDQQVFETRYEDDPSGAALIEPLVSPLMLRRLVSDVATDLPERIDAPQALLLTDPEINEYDHIREEIAEKYGAAATFVSLGRLRMYCTHPLLLEDQNYQTDPCRFSKYQRLTEILEEIFSHSGKVLVFTSWNRMNDMLVEDIAGRFGVFTAGIDGRTDIGERQNIIDRFSSEIGPALLALNPKAAGTGLNITAANHVIHYNLEWNPATEDQASARAYRRGQ
ncbi:MAG TPA: DEAD/DEAH box helicase, partial [Gammaproteobacteria bacterium]|nr:DEAD/DEAH box helicase [Gammaproteobacteria bacterium]